jgi:cytidine deaminase
MCLSFDINDLSEIAKSFYGKRIVGFQVMVARVASALLTEAGDVFTGISIEAPCGMGVCAEHSAIAEMLKNGQSKIKSIVAVNSSGIIPPCGRCRELIRQINIDNYYNTMIAIDDENICPLSELLPNPFFSSEE